MKNIIPPEKTCHDASDAETSACVDTSVWCETHGVRYTDDFRNVVYKINPNHLSCVYKQMFEASATNSLIGMDEDGLDFCDKKSEDKKLKDETNTWATIVRPPVGSCAITHNANNRYKFNSTPPHRGQSQIMRSLSSAYAAAGEKPVNKKEFRGWDVCARPHSAVCSGYLKFTSAETRDMMKNRSQSACVKPGVRREKVAMSKVQINGPPRAQSTVIRSENSKDGCHVDHSGRSHSTASKSYQESTDKAEESLSQTSSPGSSTHNIPTPCPYTSNSNQADAIPYYFEHFTQPKDHTKKYREDYTYRKLEMIRNLSAGGGSVLRLNVPSSCIPITVPVFMCSSENNKCVNAEQRVTSRPYTPTKTPNSDNSSEDVRIAINCKKAVIKKRLSKPPTQLSQNEVSHYLLTQNGMQKMQLYTDPMTFDAEENESTGGKQSPIVCRTRPTIPSNAHGNIYPSSTDTHSYIIKRQKGIP